MPGPGATTPAAEVGPGAVEEVPVGHTVGIDIGGTKIAAGVVGPGGEILGETRRHTPATDPGAIADAVVDAIAELAAAHRIGPVGVAAAGFVDAARSTVVFAPNLAWRDEPLAEHLRARLRERSGGPLGDGTVVVENDANAAAWGEYRFGGGLDASGAGVDDLLMLTLGTGLGGGIVSGGRLQRGASGAAAEVGHARAVPDGLPCGCGNTGCWEQYVSGNSLVRRGKELLRSGSAAGAALLDSAGGDPEKVDGPTITRLAQAGDAGCVELLADLGRWLGEACATFTAVLDPEVIVVGGGVCAAGDLLLEPARERFAATLSGRTHRDAPPLRVAQRGGEAGMIGAADLARRA
ncbi:ROK family glucokinase [Kineococcus gynurae]|uniref:Glucokinase n=1 Tax=Kineococcus gynurae TaxID=452979 RepID=A0ABV5LUE4_9ACTN